MHRSRGGHESDGAYSLKVHSEGQQGGKSAQTDEELTAKRVGDCP